MLPGARHSSGASFMPFGPQDHDAPLEWRAPAKMDLCPSITLCGVEARQERDA